MAHDEIKDQYDEVQAEGLYAEGMARMALYHHHCQDPVIFRALGDVGGKSPQGRVRDVSAALLVNADSTQPNRWASARGSPARALSSA